MNIQIFENEAQAYRACATMLAAQLIERPDSVLGLATGSTVEPIYAELIQLYEAGIISFAEATSFNLDEYVGLAADHEQSYHAFMFKHLFDHVDMDPDYIYMLDGKAPFPDESCMAYDDLIDATGGIDIQLLGVGQNGHIAFNEPSYGFNMTTHVIDLTENTIEVNGRFFTDKSEVPRQALTMGIGTIMKAKRVVLVATGAKKARAVKAMIEDPVDPQWPVSVLQLHANCTLLVDQEAASLLLAGEDSAGEIEL